MVICNVMVCNVIVCNVMVCNVMVMVSNNVRECNYSM